jgi:UDP-N-acetylglucosamine:LPS N-acetylglucosamine transferase
MVNVGAAKMISNQQIDQPEFSRELVSLLSDKGVLRKMGQYAHTLHKPNALSDVVAVCQEYLNA